MLVPGELVEMPLCGPLREPPTPSLLSVSILSPLWLKYDLKFAATDFEFSFNFPNAFTRGFGDVDKDNPVSLFCSFNPLVSFTVSLSSFISLQEAEEDLGEYGSVGFICLLEFARHFLKILGAENLWKIPSSSELCELLSLAAASSTLSSNAADPLLMGEAVSFGFVDGEGLRFETISCTTGVLS